MNMGYLFHIAGTRSCNLFCFKRAPIALGHSCCLTYSWSEVTMVEASLDPHECESSLRDKKNYLSIICKKYCNLSQFDVILSMSYPQISLKLPSELADRTWVAMSCFLISHGAQLELQNSRGITPISLVKDPLVIDLLRAHATDVSECMMCSDMPVSVTFLPCGHRVACGECSRRMKKCILCHLVISSKV